MKLAAKLVPMTEKSVLHVIEMDTSWITVNVKSDITDVLTGKETEAVV